MDARHRVSKVLVPQVLTLCRLTCGYPNNKQSKDIHHTTHNKMALTSHNPSPQLIVTSVSVSRIKPNSSFESVHVLYPLYPPHAYWWYYVPRTRRGIRRGIRRGRCTTRYTTTTTGTKNGNITTTITLFPHTNNPRKLLDCILMLGACTVLEQWQRTRLVTTPDDDDDEDEA